MVLVSLSFSVTLRTSPGIVRIMNIDVLEGARHARSIQNWKSFISCCTTPAVAPPIKEDGQKCVVLVIRRGL